MEDVVKDMNQNLMSNKLNNKKSKRSFVKKDNLWIFDALTNFFWNFYGKSELVKVKNVHL